MITCYLIQRQNKENLTLSPYLDINRVGHWSEDEQVVLKSSGMLTKNQRDEASYALYAAIDFSVDRWIQNKQYIPRLLISAAVFTASYFFLSLVIRDPVPMVDELLISGGLVLLAWNYLAKRDTRSSIAQRRRYELKLRCGECEQEIDEQLFAVEAFLDEASSEDSLELCNSLALVSSEPLKPISYEGSNETLKELGELLAHYLRIYNKSLYKTAVKVHNQRMQRRKNERLAARLFHQSMQKRLDIGLLALLVSLMEL
ncbi:hypothetical protein [Sphaerochaeta halotolerans]|uniref:Uncharacterized protein n=1 Tax=Sphaerochaeta halotolerans TaxID=2293840 RepID=A0A372MIU6_9SPIR|nr:hypothetical protein [Sphaerochaeta halotolerans]MBG0767065.1 hypothetical protein [Spirochaetaceae bacterium]MXI85754.1 hypothetical protein [Sphaerochaeta halotolerans]RFU95298.1 hypothetical protein DYP60_04580 [Sphaerochaeta halotolerans]